MAEYYGVIQGNRGEATRCGSKKSGLQTTAASWHGAVRNEVYTNDLGEPAYRVRLIPWHGKGESKLIAEGVLSEVVLAETT